MRDAAIPFGLLFQESASEPADLPRPRYDEAWDISLVDQDGTEVPFVCVAPSTMATRTMTEVAGESTDEDYQSANAEWCLGTMTETKVEEEATDRSPDMCALAALATGTGTRVANEDSDQD
jgi:hypothetical protein